MDLFEALKLVRDGKAITRQVWKNPAYHVKLVPNPEVSPFQQLHIFMPDKNAYDRWIICSEDLDADDWVETAPVAKPRILSPPGFPIEGRNKLVVAAKNSSPVPKKSQ